MGFEWLTELQLNDVTGDGSSGGYQGTVSFYNDQAAVQQDRQLSLYHRNFSGISWEGADRLAFEGLMTPARITATRGASSTGADIYTYHKSLGDIPVQGCWFEDSNAGEHAHQINNLSLGLIVLHILDAHVTFSDFVALDTTLVDTAGSTTVNPYIVRENGSLWQALQKVASDEFYVIYFNRSNQVVYKAHPQFAGVVPASVITLDNTMLLAPYQVEFRTGRKARNVVLLAITDAMETLESGYPSGSGTDVIGPPFEIRCNLQARLDVLAQRQFEWLNRDYVATVLVPGAWDFELYDHVKLTLSGTATNGVTFAWVAKSFWVNRVTYRRQQQYGFVTELVMDEGYVAP